MTTPETLTRGKPKRNKTWYCSAKCCSWSFMQSAWIWSCNYWDKLRGSRDLTTLENYEAQTVWIVLGRAHDSSYMNLKNILGLYLKDSCSVSLATSFPSPAPFSKFFVLDTELRQVWQHETFSRKYQFKGNVLNCLRKTMSSSADQLSSHTLLGITYTRSVQKHLQTEYWLDNSKQLCG